LAVHTGTVAVNGGLLSVNGLIVDSATPGDNGFTKAGSGLMIAGSAQLSGPLNVRDGTLRMKQLATANTTAATTSVHGLTIAGGPTPTATYDLTNNITIPETTGLADGFASHALYKQQFSYANDNFAWDRPGIFSTTAKNDFTNNGIITTVGMIWNNDGSGNPL